MYRCWFATMICLLMVPATAQDRFGDPLSEGAVQRLGTLRMKTAAGRRRRVLRG